MSREMRALIGAYEVSLSVALDAGNTNDIKKLADKAFSSTEENRKRAFLYTEVILLRLCIDHNDFDRLMTLFKAINSSDNMQLKVCSCIALSNTLIKEKNVLVNDRIHSQELGRLLTQECKQLAESYQEKISERVGEALKAIQYDSQTYEGKIEESSVESSVFSMHKR